MDRITSSSDISAQLSAAEAIPPHNLHGVQKVVGRLMTQWPNDRGIFIQLQRLADFIGKTRRELSDLRPDEVKRQFLPKATDELDAIVEATATATHSIMDAADVIMNVASRLDKADGDKAIAAVTSIYEACTFQDITGQRVTKVVNMLKVIEERIDKMILALDEFAPPGEIQAETKAHVQDETPAPTPQSAQDSIDAMFAVPSAPAATGSVLNGPALPGQGKTQAEVDAIFAGGD